MDGRRCRAVDRATSAGAPSCVGFDTSVSLCANEKLPRAMRDLVPRPKIRKPCARTSRRRPRDVGRVSSGSGRVGRVVPPTDLGAMSEIRAETPASAMGAPASGPAGGNPSVPAGDAAPPSAGTNAAPPAPPPLVKDKIERPEVPGTCLSLRLLDGAPPARHAPRGHPAGGGARAPIRRVEPERTPLRLPRVSTRPSARGAATTPNPIPRPSSLDDLARSRSVP